VYTEWLVCVKWLQDIASGRYWSDWYELCCGDESTRWGRRHV